MYPPPPPLAPMVPEPPRFLGRFAVLYGMGLGTLCFAVGFAVSLAALGGDQQTWFFTWGLIAVLVTIVVLAAGITCIVMPRTRGFGAGLLISLAIGIIVGNGACIAILANT
jgi:hypothetical protein